MGYKQEGLTLTIASFIVLVAGRKFIFFLSLQKDEIINLKKPDR
jgi:hypothetical protein